MEKLERITIQKKNYLNLKNGLKEKQENFKK